MSATNELRALLTEHKINWNPTAWSRARETFFKINGISFIAREGINDKLDLVASNYLAPKEIIEGFFSQETCEVVSCLLDTWDYNRWDYELSCGDRFIWEDDEPPRYCPDCGRRIKVNE